MIDTQRLKLLPLSHNQLAKYIANNGSLEAELGLSLRPERISSAMKRALQENLLPEATDTGRNHYFTTLWVLILKSVNGIIGDLCFVGEPDEDGEVEIGYATYEDFRNKGYMTEAVAAIIQWAKSQEDVKSIFAETAKDNPASFAVLTKNHFKKVGEADDLFYWRLVIS
ncbi:GNAT family N-acetyltransferase [Pedobacter sp. KR3-3]|uniref:GNAT family N-acetyltransferase n=1 Tax=Pedobacter albus TaxID=3113905 RepID=A0ABU7I806_9SPHI|nr:GNAT family N-acetyltransferase [Pedobacter sp. KR3-3]MEE1945603.1 GNAT family N-acetyltransferase [Pedobacter sp. KR3-3]